MPQWLREVESFYRVEQGKRYFYSIMDKKYREVPLNRGQVSLILLKSAAGVVEHNAAASLIDIGDGIFCLEFHSKMNTMGGDTLAMIQKGLRRSEADGLGTQFNAEGPAPAVRPIHLPSPSS